jgi:hypothetical protein
MTESENTSRANAASVAGAFMNAFNELGRAMMPCEKAQAHFKEARKQALMGLRELIDSRIQAMSKDDIKATRIVAE